MNGERFDRISTGHPYRPQTRAIDPREIVIAPGWNVRDMNSPSTLEWVETLKAAISTAGYDQTKPISVKYDKQTGVPTLVDGQCRLTACKQLREEGLEIWVPCVVTEGSEDALIAESVSGNAQHNLSQWEIGDGCRRLQRFGWSTAKIAATICKSQRYVTEAIALSNIPVEAKELLSAGTATPGAVLHAVDGKDGDSLLSLKETIEARAAEDSEPQTILPGNKPKARKIKPVTRPKKPSIREVAATDSSSPLLIADDLAAKVLDDDVAISDVQELARQYQKARRV